MNDLRKSLEERRDRVIAQLRNTVPAVFSEYISVTSALDALIRAEEDELRYFDFVKYNKPSEAIIAYLEQTGRWQDRIQLGEEIETRGFQKGKNTRPKWNIIDSADYVATLPEGRIVKRESDGKVGLREWLTDGAKRN